MIIDSIFSQSMDDILFWQKTKSVGVSVACCGGEKNEDHVSIFVAIRICLFLIICLRQLIGRFMITSFMGKGILKKEGTGHGEKNRSFTIGEFNI